MHKFFFPFLLLSTHASAQDVRTTMLNDSVRQEERIGKRDKVLSRHFFIGERPVGIWQDSDYKGRLIERDFGKLRYSTSLHKDSNVKGLIDSTGQAIPPQFPGGDAEMLTFLNQTVRYPGEAADAGIMGMVYVEAVVDETGDWRTIAIRRSAHPFLDYEAWRVSELMPHWTPATIDGKPVSVQYVLPINFELQ